VSGSRSRKELKYLAPARDAKALWRSEREWREAFDQVFEATTPELERAGIELHAQDRCEYSKYATVCLGGRPKRRYARGQGGGDLFSL
jgi:hypothetical protein